MSNHRLAMAGMFWIVGLFFTTAQGMDPSLEQSLDSLCLQLGSQVHYMQGALDRQGKILNEMRDAQEGVLRVLSEPQEEQVSMKRALRRLNRALKKYNKQLSFELEIVDGLNV